MVCENSGRPFACFILFLFSSENVQVSRKWKQINSKNKRIDLHFQNTSQTFVYETVFEYERHSRSCNFFNMSEAINR